MTGAKRILVIEDDEDLGNLLRTRLAASGYEVFVAQDAMIGTQIAYQYKPDLILLDLMLPAGGGVTVLRRLKSSVYTASIPVLVMSGIERDLFEDYQEVRSIGIEGYLPKPFEAKELLSTVQRVLLA